MRTMPIKRILIPTDLSASGLIALRYARFFAERFAAGMVIIYSEPLVFGVGEISTAMFYIASASEKEQLEKSIRDYANDTLRGIAYEAAAIAGDPVPSIVHEASDRNADLIVMATHGLRGWRRAVFGSVTEGVLHQGNVPVLSVSRPEDRSREPVSVTRILCPINFTDVSRDALDRAVDLAESFDCELTVVHVVEEADRMRAAVVEEDIRGWIDSSIQDRCTVRQLVLRGGAAERVLDCADDLGADLIVIGAKHKMFHDVTTIGTTTEQIVRFARMPVFTVPFVAKARSASEARAIKALAGPSS